MFPFAISQDNHDSISNTLKIYFGHNTLIMAKIIKDNNFYEMNVSILMSLAQNWNSPPNPISVCVCVVIGIDQCFIFHPQHFQWVSQVWAICTIFCLLHILHCPFRTYVSVYCYCVLVHFLSLACYSDSNHDCDSLQPTVYMPFSHICFPVRKKSGRSSLALAVWNSSLSLNLHSSSSSSLPTVCLKELRSALMTHRVAPTGRQTGGRRTETLTMTWKSKLLQDATITINK